eukprot:1149345-Pelagomonas_calceolata.AAC.11
MLAASTQPLALTSHSNSQKTPQCKPQCKPGLRPWHQHRANQRKFPPATRVGLDERLESEPAWQHSEHKRPTQQPTQQAPSQPEVPQIFDYEHFPHVDPFMLAFFPLGVGLALSRVLLWVVCIALDLPVFRNRNVGFHVMVSNHTNCGDLMALFTLPQRSEGP